LLLRKKAWNHGRDDDIQARDILIEQVDGSSKDMIVDALDLAPQRAARRQLDLATAKRQLAAPRRTSVQQCAWKRRCKSAAAYNLTIRRSIQKWGCWGRQSSILLRDEGKGSKGASGYIRA